MTGRNPWALSNYAVDHFACDVCGVADGERCRRLDGHRVVAYPHADRMRHARPFWIVERPR